MRAKISVIIPVYNARDYLLDCLRSVAGQTWPELEVLLIDDGSTDDSARLCRGWCEKDKRFRLLQKKNGGVSSARNLGLEEATGDYVAFVDADDWLCPKMLEHQADCLEEEKSDMAICGFWEVGEADRKRFRENSGEAERTERPEHRTMAVEAYVGDYLLAGNTRCWSILFRKKVVERVRFQEGLTIGEDLLFLIDLLPGLERVSLIKSREYCYYKNEEGAMFSGFRPAYMDQVTCWQQAREKIRLCYPDYTVKADISLFQAALLTAGKLALLPAGERRKQADYIRICRKAAAEAASDKKVRKGLPAGYKIKGLLFLYAPSLYMCLYHRWKRPAG